MPIDSGFDIVMGMPRGDIKRKMCREALIEMGDPFKDSFMVKFCFQLQSH